MIDEQIRRLEVAWRTSGAIDDEVRYLRERLRSGQLTVEGLRLAGGLGHSAARLLVDARPIAPLDPVATVWPKSSPPSPARERAGLAMARAMVRLHLTVRYGTREEHRHRTRIFERAVSAAEEWVACACIEHGIAALEAFEALPINVCGGGCCWGSEDVAAELAGLALDAVSEIPWPSGRFLGLADLALDPSFANDPRVRQCVEEAERAIREELIPWALEGPRPLDSPRSLHSRDSLGVNGARPSGAPG